MEKEESCILIVDDDPFSRQVIIDILNQTTDPDVMDQMFRVITAVDGTEAVRVATETVPDAILMDWQMPGISGLEVLKKLKAQQATREIPVLMVTSVASDDKLQEAFEAGAVDYITKPVREIELLVRVKSVLRTMAYHREILKQKQEIEDQKKDITDSIRYARDIQTAILPDEDEITDALPGTFVLYKPKDIVSGDFYWLGRKENKIVLAACDCTGHGVPGAFVSMVGNDLLNQIVLEKGIVDPAEILSLLNAGMIKVFTGTPQKPDTIEHAGEHPGSPATEVVGSPDGSPRVQDGMDMALCVFNDDFEYVEFSGARNPLYHIRAGVLTEVMSDKTSIGGRTPIDYKFTQHRVELQSGDCVYIFSDGFCDQLGGKRDRKFMARRFKELLLEIHDSPPGEKRQILNRKITSWKGDRTQIDDILVIGVQVKAS